MTSFILHVCLFRPTLKPLVRHLKSDTPLMPLVLHLLFVLSYSPPGDYNTLLCGFLFILSHCSFPECKLDSFTTFLLSFTRNMGQRHFELPLQKKAQGSHLIYTALHYSLPSNYYVYVKPVSHFFSSCCPHVKQGVFSIDP
ncbi:hypothetical protein BO83DRAFT_66186 [Aspergillus eucalypticola CBS 122712]|uniref:Uncharacterized protein n=1 Tax=Aspergillus eucalypticola (strain CBS 122712 / IBT 29274) TaxID=1448314 RepID=A0A317VB34_ASPEC|nr:uncharacterized protein BO83DRAFT_66186 [Aspergillus eucalypticola CBS 122712]PWY70152.1 hypothetical protein BO83DRAFT_66186 [Aspergillus eucalypticola CBS 122712]